MTVSPICSIIFKSLQAGTSFYRLIAESMLHPMGSAIVPSLSSGLSGLPSTAREPVEVRVR